MDFEDLEEQNAEEGEEAPAGAPEYLRLTTLQELLKWYRLNLVESEIRDPRGYRVIFPEPEFVHLIKFVTKHGKEPKNRQLTIEQIDSGRIQLVAGRISL